MYRPFGDHTKRSMLCLCPRKENIAFVAMPRKPCKFEMSYTDIVGGLFLSATAKSFSSKLTAMAVMRLEEWRK
jgi:hypothetical protein